MITKMMTFLTLTVFVGAAYGEQILKLPSGTQYLGNQTVDRSGIFVDCDKQPHSSAEGQLQPTSKTCDAPKDILVSAPSLITLAPLKVVNVDLQGKKIKVEGDSTEMTLDLRNIPKQRFVEFTEGTQIGVVTDQKNKDAKWVVPETIFGGDFAVYAKDKQDEKDKPPPGHL